MTKDVVPTETVHVGKRKRQTTQQVEQDVRKEEIVVDARGHVNVQGDDKTPPQGTSMAR